MKSGGNSRIPLRCIRLHLAELICAASAANCALTTASPDTAVIRRMSEKLARRGPDHEGLISDGPLAFGHRRLSIIDLSPSSDQPMVDKELRLSLVFNGTIYNYKELRSELRRWAMPSSPKATAKSSSRPTMPGARNAWSASTACSPSPCGTCATPACSWRATASASSRCITRWTAPACASPPASRRCLPQAAWTPASTRSPCTTTSPCTPSCPLRAPSSTA